jgi:hypothetical protein
MNDSPLFDVVEEVRSEIHPGIDPGLIREILECHLRFGEEPELAAVETEALIARWVSAHLKESEEC